MRKIGLVGGMAPESTRLYYDTLIDLGKERLEGALNNPVVLIYSINLSEIVHLESTGRRDEVALMLADVLERLRLAGAEVGALTSNTSHMYFDEIAARTSLPMVSIVDVAFERARALGCRRALLLGTGKTMESDIYPRRFAAGGIEIRVPDEEERRFIDRSIYRELCVGLLRDETRRRYVEICSRQIADGHVDAVVLGCTEIPLLLREDDLPVPVIDTGRTHAEAIFERAME